MGTEYASMGKLISSTTTHDARIFSIVARKSSLIFGSSHSTNASFGTPILKFFTDFSSRDILSFTNASARRSLCESLGSKPAIACKSNSASPTVLANTQT